MTAVVSRCKYLHAASVTLLFSVTACKHPHEEFLTWLTSLLHAQLLESLASMVAEGGQNSAKCERKGTHSLHLGTCSKYVAAVSTQHGRQVCLLLFKKKKIIKAAFLKQKANNEPRKCN